MGASTIQTGLVLLQMECCTFTPKCAKAAPVMVSNEPLPALMHDPVALAQHHRLAAARATGSAQAMANSLAAGYAAVAACGHVFDLHAELLAAQGVAADEASDGDGDAPPPPPLAEPFEFEFVLPYWQ